MDVFVITTKEIAQSLVQGKTDKYFITKYKTVKFLEGYKLRSVTTDMVWGAGVDLKTDNDNSVRIDGNAYGNYIVEATAVKHI